MSEYGNNWEDERDSRDINREVNEVKGEAFNQ